MSLAGRLARRLVPPPEPPEPNWELVAEQIAAREQMPDLSRFRWCRSCDVKWFGLRACWCCGKPAAGI